MDATYIVPSRRLDESWKYCHRCLLRQQQKNCSAAIIEVKVTYTLFLTQLITVGIDQFGVSAIHHLLDV